MKLRAYCDGASRKDGRGGWGYTIQNPEGEELWFDCGGNTNTTNNRMELTAAIKVLRRLPSPSYVTIFSDSKYVVEGATGWKEVWIRARWRTSSNQPVQNIDLWKALHELEQRHIVTWGWVRGHSGNPGNERADALAAEGIRRLECPE